MKAAVSFGAGRPASGGDGVRRTKEMTACPTCGQPIPDSRLVRYRKARGFTVHTLAAKAGVSASSISRFENGKEMWLSQAAKVARALGISIDELVLMQTGPSVSANEDVVQWAAETLQSEQRQRRIRRDGEICAEATAG
jgi:transcriptional regulator with XRE-family HTH domain